MLAFLMVTLVDLGTVFWMGAQLWRTFVLQLTDTGNRTQETIERRIEERFDRDFSMPILFMLLLANVGVLLGQGLVLTGGNLGQALTPAILGPLATTGRFGTYWLMREIVIFLAIVLAAITLQVKKLPRSFTDLVPWLNLILGLALLIALTMSGPAAATNGTMLVYAVLIDWLHLLAASLWVGGILYVSLIYLPVLKGNTVLERAGSLVSLLPHYSPLVITGVIIMAVSGPFNAAVHLTALNQLATTAYGRALVIKVLLTGALLLTSAIHIGILRPHLKKDYMKYLALSGVEQHTVVAAPDTLPESAAIQHTSAPEAVRQLESSIAMQTRRLTTMLRWEPLLGVGVLICTGLMTVFAGTLLPIVVSQPAPVAPTPRQQVKPFNTTVTTSDKLFTVKMTVSPNHFGSNVFTATVMNSKGTVVTNVGVSIYTTMLDMDMGTDAVNLQPDGKGHFSATGDLEMGGNWGLRVQIRAQDHKLHEGSVKMVTPY
jgi:copper transport protein